MSDSDQADQSDQSDQLIAPDPKAVAYDLAQALASVVSVRARIPEDAFTASVLGTERAGHGVVIRDSGLILTIGYLVTEANDIWLVDNHGRTAQGYVIGYDQETGFGLVQALQPLTVPALPLGSSATLAVGEPVVMAGHGGRRQSIQARVIAKQEFAGYWEYVLDEAIFTAPAHPNWGGAALLGPDGTLRGIGSLMVQESANNDAPDGNMIVPIDLLPPILDDMLNYGRPNRPARPWLGMMATEIKGNLIVINLVDDGPAQAADIHVGDVVLAVAGESVNKLASLFRKIWSLGSAGVDVPLTVLRNAENVTLHVQSVSRYDSLKTPKLH